MAKVKHYLSLVKFSHTIFAMPFAMIGFVLGVSALPENSWKGWNIHFSTDSDVNYIITKLLLVLVCMVSARSAAMAFNRYLDRNFDAKNPRTSIREIPAGIITANGALWFTIFSSLVFTVATYFINTMCFLLSPVALFVILFYSFTKRFTSLCHLVLGLGLALAPIGAYLAVTNQWAIMPVLFSFTVLFWVSGFDIIYAMQDVEFDREHALHSIPVALGRRGALNLSNVLHILAGLLVIAAGFYGEMGWLYWFGVVVFIGALVYQHSIVSPNDLSRVNIAFMTANGIASVVFGCFVIADILLK